MPIQILNARLGFAANSSSTHSIIFGASAPGGDQWEHANDFFAQSRDAKRNAVGIGFIEQLIHEVGERFALTLARDLIGDMAWSPSGNGMDTYAVPRVRRHRGPWETTRAVHEEFLAAWIEFVCREDVSLAGAYEGNVRDGSGKPPEDARHQVSLQRLWNGAIARYDGLADAWAIFSPETGSKLRIRFPEIRAETLVEDSGEFVFPEAGYPAADRPELVDVSITDFCPYGCAYCYMGSTPEGLHAKGNRLAEIASALGELEVFECAIGGGEPTLNPEFPWFVDTLRARDVVPNFTTRNLAYLVNPENQATVANAGAIAVSVDHRQDIEQLVRRAEQSELFPVEKLTLQVVEGSMPPARLGQILEAAWKHDFPVTVLGFKETGRGMGYPRAPGDWLDEALRLRDRNRVPRLSIDTVLVQRDGDRLMEAGISPTLLQATEGTHSMWIDAVNWRIAPSSFSVADQVVKLGEGDSLVGHIMKRFPFLEG